MNCSKLATRDHRSSSDTGDCAKAARKDSYLLPYVPNCFKTKEMCSEVIHKELYLLHLTLTQ